MEILKKYKKMFLSEIIILLMLLVFINIILVIKAPFKVAQDSDWIGFWGSVFGLVISGMVTFTALKITIDNENIKRKEELSYAIMPYINYTVIKKDEFNKFDNLKSIGNCINISSKNRKYLKRYTPIFNFKFKLENLGLGPAIKFKVKGLNYENTKIKLVSPEKFQTLYVREGATLEFRIYADEEEIVIKTKDNMTEVKGYGEEATIIVSYCDLINNNYEQEIHIKFRCRLIEEKRLIIEEVYISKVSEAKLIN